MKMLFRSCKEEDGGSRKEDEPREKELCAVGWKVGRGSTQTERKP